MRIKNILSHKGMRNKGVLLKVPGLLLMLSGSEMHPGAVWDEKDSPLLSGVKQVKLLSGKSFPKFALTSEISG